MENNETISALAVVLSILALFACIGIGGYIYLNQSQSIDISGISDNALKITLIQNDVNNLESDIDNLDLTCDCDIDEDDFEDLEEEIEDNHNDIKDIIKCIEEYTYTGEGNHTALRDCIEDI